MQLELLEIGKQTSQLSACRSSLLLGVYTAHNQVKDFMKFACQLLGAEHAVFHFYDEPYIWYWHHPRQMFKACLRHPDEKFQHFYQNQAYLDVRHANYPDFVAHLQQVGVIQQRFIGFNLNYENQYNLGHVVFFDNQQQPFATDVIEMVCELVEHLLRQMQLQQDYAELKEEYEQQVANDFSKTKFFQIIAHDLRAPFHGLLGFSEVLAQERDTLNEEAIQNIAEYLYDTTQSTYNLLENLLNWAITEGGRFVCHPINFEIKQSVKIVKKVLNALAIKKNIQLIDHVPEGIKVYADINMLTSVIQNLVSNALKFTPTDGSGQVLISVEQNNTDYVKLKVQDSGLGMSSAQIQQIFEPKVKASHRGTLGERGTGLGLVLCKRFVDLNHGQIYVSSKEGVGTTFQVLLPAAQNNHQALAECHYSSSVSP